MSVFGLLEQKIARFIGAPDESFNELALEVYRFQRENNEAYGNYCRHLEAAPEHWSQIPAVPQSAFKQFALRSFPAEATTHTFRTSGTTGEGFGSHHFCSLALYKQAVLAGWDRLPLPALPQIVLTPTPEQAPHSSLSQMMGFLRERTGEQRFCMEAEALEPLLRSCQTPVLLLGTALAFLNLFERGTRFHLSPGSFAMETGGYKGSGRDISKAELYARFQEFLGLPSDSIFNEYGMTELSSQFYTRGLGHAHHGAPWVRALVMDPETGMEAQEGQVGTLRIFDLANLGSVLAIQTRDLAIRRGENFELLGRDPAALPRGCSRAADELLQSAPRRLA